MEYPVFEAKCVLAVRGARDPHGDAGVALARLAASGLFRVGLATFIKLLLRERLEFEAVQVGQRGADIGMLADLTGFDPLDDQRLDRFLDLLAVAIIEHRFDHALVGGSFWADPARASVPVITERIKIRLRSRRSRIEGAVAVKLHARDQEMQLDITHVLVAHPEDIRLIPLKPRKGGCFEITHHSRLMCLGGIIISMKGHHARGVAPLSRVAVDHSAGQVGIT